MIIKLKKPVVVGPNAITEIKLREPTIGEVMIANVHLKNGFGGSGLDLFCEQIISSVSGLSLSTVAELPTSAMKQCMKYVQTFPVFSPAVPEAQDNLEDEYIIPLAEPLKAGSVEATEITIVEPKQKHIRDANKVLVEDVDPKSIDSDTTVNIHAYTKSKFKLLVDVSGLPSPIIKQLPISKFRECEKILGFFLAEPTEDLETDTQE